MATEEKADPNTRLLITHLDLVNFKSYHGRKTIGPFHKRFSSIIGPNGSGKSNVIDALLFVFGKKASKIRLKKVSELVHNSSNHPECKQATVTVHFQIIKDVMDSDDDYQVVPGKDFSITRVATKSNKSQYFINNDRAKLEEVKRKLSEHDIDLKNNRFLILQGEVESISLMKPKGANPNEEGLLEYLEDIIGTNKYVEGIAKAAEQEELLGMEVQERLNRVKVVERDRNKLEGAKSEAENYLRKELELYCQQGVLKQLEIHQGNREILVETENKTAMEQQLEEEKAKSVGVREELKALESEYQELLQNRNAIVEERERLNKEFQKQEQEDVTLKERVAYLKKEIKKAKTNKTKSEAIIEKCEATIAKNEAEIPELQEANTALARRLEQAQGEEEELMERVQSRVQPFREEMEAKQKELMPLKDIENQAQQRLDVVVDQIKSLEQTHETNAQRFTEVQERMGAIEQNVGEKSEQTRRLNDELKTLQGRLAEAQHALRELEREEREMAGRVQNGRELYAAKQQAMNHQGARHYIAADLLAQQERGHLSGIIGRLGDLGRIDDEFDVAVSTAGAGGLNCIVVEKTHHAQQAVKYLKRSKRGRATFLILEKQHQTFRNKIGRIETPEGAPRLFDLITPHEERFAVAFYYALRDTLVADNLEDGNRLAFGNFGGRRWRVATKRGQLIETSGTMSGGGGKPRSGLMSSRRRSDEVTPEELERIQHELQAVEAQYGQVRERKRNCAKECENLERELNAKNVELRKLNLQLDGDRKRFDDLRGQLPELEAASRMTEEDEAEIRNLSRDVKRLEKEKAVATKNCASLNDVIEDLQQSILDAGGAELREKRKEVEAIQNRLAENEKTITRYGVEIETSTKKITTNRKKVATLDQELTQMLAEREEAKANRQKVLERAVELTEACEAKKEEEKAITKHWKKLEATVKAKEKIVQEAAKLEMQLEEKIGECRSAIKSLTRMVKSKHNDLKALAKKIKKNRRHLRPDEGDDDTDQELKDDVPPDADAPAPMDVDDEDDGKDREEEKASEEDPRETASGPIEMDLDDDESSVLPPNVENLVERDGSIRMLNDQELNQLTTKEVESNITELAEELKALKPNMSAIEAYRRKDDEYVHRLHDLNAVKEKRDENRQTYDELRNTRLTEFMAGFNKITMKLKEMYRMLTQGGDAELELVDSIDPFAEGVQFSVRPPKKSWKNISNLSGGEKTLSSMALVFALHHCYPTPLYVMDEIDAALDFKNVSIVANYIKERTKNAQFIIISLRNNMFELANRLVGIYKTHNVSKTITINPNLFHLSSVPLSDMGGKTSLRATEENLGAPLASLSQNVGGQRVFSPSKRLRDVGDSKDEDEENALVFGGSGAEDIDMEDGDDELTE